MLTGFLPLTMRYVTARIIYVISILTMALSCPASAEAPACPSAPPFEHGTAVLPTIRVYTGADGVSHIEHTAVKGFTVPFFKTGKLLTQTVLGPSLKVVLVQGPADESIPIRAGIGRVMFLTLQGSSTVVLPDGEEATSLPGGLVIFDDKGSKTGHGGRTGKCGYVALSIAIPDQSPDFVAQH